MLRVARKIEIKCKCLQDLDLVQPSLGVCLKQKKTFVRNSC